MMKFKKQLKRGLSMTLTLAMCMGTLQATALADEWSNDNVTTPSGDTVSVSGEKNDKEGGGSSWSGESADGKVSVSGESTPVADSDYNATGESTTDPADGGYNEESNSINTNPADPSGTKVETQTTTTPVQKEIGKETETVTVKTEGFVTEGGLIKEDTVPDVKVEDTTKDEDKVLKPVAPEDAKLDISVEASAAQGKEGFDQKDFDNTHKENAAASLNPDSMLKGNGYVCADDKDQPNDGSSKYVKGEKDSDNYSEAIVKKVDGGYETTVTTTEKHKIDETVSSDKIASDTLDKLQGQGIKEGDKITVEGKEMEVASVARDDNGNVKGYTLKYSETDTTVKTGTPTTADPSSDAPVPVEPNTTLTVPDGSSYTFADGTEASNVTVTQNADGSYTVTATVDAGAQYTDENGNPVIPTVTRTETVSLSALEQMLNKQNRTDITNEERTIDRVITYVYTDDGEVIITTTEVLKQSVELKDGLKVTVDMGNVGVERDEDGKIVSEHGTLYEDFNGDGKYDIMSGTSMKDMVSEEYGGTAMGNVSPETAFTHVEDKFGLIRRDEVVATDVTVTQEKADDKKFSSDMKVNLAISESKLNGNYLYLDIKNDKGETLQRAYLSDGGEAYWIGKDGTKTKAELERDNNGAITGVTFKDVQLDEGENKLKLQLFGYQKVATIPDKQGRNTEGYALIDLQADVTVTISGIKAEYKNEHNIAQETKTEHNYARQEQYVQTDELTTDKTIYEVASREVTDTKTTDFSLTSGTRPGTPATPEPEPEPTPEPEPEPTPIPMLPGGGTGTTTGDTVTVADAPTPLAEAPVVDVPETEVPLAETPAETEIPEEAVPLADVPAEVVIVDDAVPLAEVPKTGDISGLWYAAAVLSLGGWMLVRGKKNEEEDA